MTLSLLLRSLYPRFKNMFRFFDELAVQIYRIAWHTVGGVVFTENVVGGLFVVLVYFGGVLF